MFQKLYTWPKTNPNPIIFLRINIWILFNNLYNACYSYLPDFSYSYLILFIVINFSEPKSSNSIHLTFLACLSICKKQITDYSSRVRHHDTYFFLQTCS